MDAGVPSTGSQRTDARYLTVPLSLLFLCLSVSVSIPPLVSLSPCLFLSSHLCLPVFPTLKLKQRSFVLNYIPNPLFIFYFETRSS